MYNNMLRLCTSVQINLSSSLTCLLHTCRLLDALVLHAVSYGCAAVMHTLIALAEFGRHPLSVPGAVQVQAASKQPGAWSLQCQLALHQAQGSADTAPAGNPGLPV